jgi:hypothetical protein
VKTIEEKIDLMVRFMEACSWSVWDSQDAELNRLRDLRDAVYKANRNQSFTRARMEADRALLREIFLDD